MTRWVSVSRTLPPLDEAVWLYDESTGDMWVGMRSMESGDDWAWGHSYGNFWWSDNKHRWEGDCITDDDYQPTHWAPLITPPSKYPSADLVYP